MRFIIKLDKISEEYRIWDKRKKEWYYAAGTWPTKDALEPALKRLNDWAERNRLNPSIKRGKWVPVHAVRFNRDGSISIMK